jgi:death on curing protein
MQDISILDVERIAFKLTRQFMAFDEPIPDYSKRFPNVLESCLATPFQWFAGRSLYRGIISKASMLFYLMIKNHPFLNGNKRIAITTLLVFLYLNKKWLRVDLDVFYKFSIDIATSRAEDKNNAVLAIRRFIRAHIIDFSSAT